MRRIAPTAFWSLTYFLLVFCCLTIPSGMMAQARKPLTAADLAQMKSMGFDDQTIINAIAADGISLDTSLQGIEALKKFGLSDKVISAALAAAAPKPTASGDPSAESGLPDEIGIYARVKGQLTPLPVEIVNFKTAGTLGTAFTYGIRKTKIQGTVPGEKSSAQLALPVTFVLRCPDGTAPNEYQLIQLQLKNGSREYTAGKGNIAGASAGVDKEAVTISFEKIGRDTYKGTIADLKKGEYGFLAPGTVVSATSASNGKMYSFGIPE